MSELTPVVDKADASSGAAAGARDVDAPPIDWDRVVANELLNEGHTFDFFQMLRRIELLAAEMPRIGHAKRASADSVRIGQSAELDFARTTIDQVTASPDGKARVQQRFFGLLGPVGPMPLHVTQQVRDQVRHERDDTLDAFLDLFHHRMATMFYRAWSSSRGAIQRDRPDADRFAELVAALTGAMSQATPCGDAAVDGDGNAETRQYYSGRFGGLHRNAEGLEAVVSGFTGTPVKVATFALRSLRLQPEDHSLLRSPGDSGEQQVANRRPDMALGRACQLGRSAVLGRSVPDRVSSITLTIGPVEPKDFAALLPGRERHQALRRLVREFIGPVMDCRVHLVLRRQQTPQVSLGGLGTLGRTAWVGRNEEAETRDDCHFDV